MDVTQYFNETYIWEKFIKADEDGVDTWQAPKKIKARRERSGRFVRTPDGNMIQSNALYMTKELIGEKDLINGEPVISAHPINDFDATYIHTECYV